MTLYTNKELPEIAQEKLFTVTDKPDSSYKLIYEIIK